MTPDFFATDSETEDPVSLIRVGEHLFAYPSYLKMKPSVEVLAQEAADWSSGKKKPTDPGWLDAPEAVPGWVPPEPPASPKMYEEFRHYKGGLYQVFNLAWDTRHNHWAVVYVSRESGKWWVRPHEMFMGRVEDGRPRFARQF